MGAKLSNRSTGKKKKAKGHISVYLGILVSGYLLLTSPYPTLRSCCQVLSIVLGKSVFLYSLTNESSLG